MSHKYQEEEFDAQVDIKEAGFPISMMNMGIRASRPAYNPTFEEPEAITLYPLDVSDDQKFRRNTAVAKFDKILMVSTENITDANKPEVGTEVDITSTDAFPNLPEQKLQIVELRQLALAGVPIFYTFVLDGQATDASTVEG